MIGSRRLAAALVLSMAVHVVAIGLLSRPRAMTPAVVFPIALVGSPGGGGGGGAPEPTPPAVAEAAPAPLVAAPAPVVVPPKPRVARKPTPTPTQLASTRPAIDTVGSSGASGAGDGVTSGGQGPGSGGGTGGGSAGGDGSGGGARVAYGANPAPAYPLVARRLGMEGMVMLEVVVAPDGTAAEVRVLQSSGHAPLDESALRTVRTSWRFIPARQDGVPVTSRVTVPIRFRLTEASG